MTFVIPALTRRTSPSTPPTATGSTSSSSPAPSFQIYDLIKVDSIVRDINAVQDKLMIEAWAVIRQKVARYEQQFGIKVEPPAEVYAERPAIHYPPSSTTRTRPPKLNPCSARATTTTAGIQARKGATFFFNGLDGNGFDKVINPVSLEPVVQFTLYLKLKYGVAR